MDTGTHPASHLMEPVTFVVDVADEIHDCAWIQAFDQLVYLPIGLLLHILIDGISTLCGFGEVNIEPICKVGLLQGLQELRPWLEAVVHEYGGPFAGVLIRRLVCPFEEHMKGLIYICLRQHGVVETQTAEKLPVRLSACSYGQGSQGHRHTNWGEEEILAL